MRIERLPKFIRDYIPELQDYQESSYRFTNSIEFEEAELPMIAESHPLFNATLELMKKSRRSDMALLYCDSSCS